MGSYQRPGAEPYHLEVEPRMVTVCHGGETIAVSSCAIRVWRDGEAPVFFIPKDDVSCVGLEPSCKTVAAPGLGRARMLHLKTPTARIEEAAYALEETTPLGARLKGRVGFDAGKIRPLDDF